MNAWAVPGTKVICVDASDLGADLGVIKKGATYTIRSVQVQTDFTGKTDLAFRLQEVIRETCRVTGQQDLGFRANRFRPLTTRTQSEDVALFRKLLETAGADA